MGHYPFFVSQQQYVVHTVPGSARAGLYCPREKCYLGYYDPATSPNETGVWVKTTYAKALAHFTPYVQKICEYRRANVFGGADLPYPFVQK